MKTKVLMLAAVVAAFALMQVGCTPEEITVIPQGGTLLTQEPEVAHSVPVSLVGTEWKRHEEWVSHYEGMDYEMIDDVVLVFETDSSGVREVHGYPSSNVPEEWSLGPYPFTYTYDSVTGTCYFHNISANNDFVYVYNLELDALVRTDASSRTYYRVK